MSADAISDGRRVRSLIPGHERMLRESAVGSGVAAAAGVYSVESADDLPRELSWVARHASGLPGIVFPWRSPDGRVTPQYRPDTPIDLGDGHPRKYLFPQGAPPVLWLHAGPADPGTVLIVEGTKQSLAAAAATEAESRTIAVVGMAGCWGWSSSGLAVPDLAALPVEGRDVVVVMDADVSTNRAVWDAARRLADVLAAYGAAAVRHLRVPASGTAGLDDFLAGAPQGPRRQAVMARLIAAAGPLGRAPAAVRRAGQAQADAPAPPVDTFDDIADEPGCVVLDAVAELLGRHVAFRSDAQRDAVVLWVAHTHMIEHSDTTPRLAVLSPAKGSGKTRLLELVEMVARRARLHASLSPPYLYRLVETATPTLLVDEVDAVFGSSAKNERNEELRALINTGHRRGATVGRIVGEGSGMKPAEFATFCPVVLAGIGDCLPDTVLDRCVVIGMRRRLPDETVEPLRRRRVEPRGARLNRRLAAWAQRAADGYDPDPAMPPGITDRPADVWEPLIAVAELAGGTWPQRAREACVVLNDARNATDGSIELRLLTDLRNVIGGKDAMYSAKIVEALNADEDAPWSGWHKGAGFHTRDLARMLRPYGITSTNIRGDDGAQRKGYRADNLADAFDRYLPPCTTPGTSVPPSHNGQRPIRTPSDQGWDGRNAGTDFPGGMRRDTYQNRPNGDSEALSGEELF